MALTIKFPIGSRVRHSFGGPATVIGDPFLGADGYMNLPVKWDSPDTDDGARGWYEENFTLIEPGWARDPRTVALMARCDAFEEWGKTMRGCGQVQAQAQEVERLKNEIANLRVEIVRVWKATLVKHAYDAGWEAGWKASERLLDP
jgi:hypothetical protein